MNRWILISGSLILGIVLIWGFVLLQKNQTASLQHDQPLVFYCAAGIQIPVDQIVKEYENEYGVSVQVNYGGSGTLLSNLRVTQTGDLFLAADDSYIQLARELDLLEESIPLATMIPVIAVAKGNPKKIHGIQDLMRDDVRFALANPDAAAVGRIARDLLQKEGIWDSLNQHVTVSKPTVNEIANDLKIGAVDAGIVWDAFAASYPELEIIHSPLLDLGQQTISVGIVKKTLHPTDALRFARYLSARDKGLPVFEKFGFHPVQGDVWAETPHVVFYSGGVNRLAIEDTLKRFQEREGVQIDTVYNGCGILVGQMKLGERPDAYFACDVSFIQQVGDLFYDPLNVSETDMVIVTAKGNPKGIRSLQDLSQGGLRLGVANAEQSALGALTKRLFDQLGIYDRIKGNIQSQTPTADLLVNQLRTGSLDAVIVYEANTPYVRQELELVRIDHPAAKAIQPYAVGKSSAYPHLMERLMKAICSAPSKEKFQSIGFHWLADREQP